MKARSLIAASMVAALPGFALAQGTATGGSPADQANLQAMQKMQKDMPKQGTGDPDRDFVTMMLPHHQGAVDMAKVELRFGKDPELRKMARAIVKAQEKEIVRMQRWQAKQAK